MFFLYACRQYKENTTMATLDKNIWQHVMQFNPTKVVVGSASVSRDFNDYVRDVFRRDNHTWSDLNKQDDDDGRYYVPISRDGTCPKGASEQVITNRQRCCSFYVGKTRQEWSDFLFQQTPG